MSRHNKPVAPIAAPPKPQESGDSYRDKLVERISHLERAIPTLQTNVERAKYTLSVQEGAILEARWALQEYDNSRKSSPAPTPNGVEPVPNGVEP